MRKQRPLFGRRIVRNIHHLGAEDSVERARWTQQIGDLVLEGHSIGQSWKERMSARQFVHLLDLAGSTALAS